MTALICSGLKADSTRRSREKVHLCLLGGDYKYDSHGSNYRGAYEFTYTCTSKRAQNNGPISQNREYRQYRVHLGHFGGPGTYNWPSTSKDAKPTPI